MFKSITRKITSLVLLSYLLSFGITSATAEQAPNDAGQNPKLEKQQVEKKPITAPKRIKKLCMIIVPGLSVEAVNRFTLPSIAKFSRAGILTKGTYSSYPSNLDMDLANLFTGNLPDEHKYTKYGADLRSATLFNEMANYGRGSIVIDGLGRMKPLTAGAKLKTVASTSKSKSLEELVDVFIENLNDEAYFGAVLVTPNLNSESNDERYRNQQALDTQFARILGSLINQGIYDETVIVLAGTNGSTKSSSKEITNPLVINGPQFKSGFRGPAVKLSDITPTLSYLITGKIPQSSGLVMWDLYSQPDYDQAKDFLERRIRELSVRASDEHMKGAELYQEIESFKWERMRIDDQQKIAEMTIREKKEQIEKLETIVSLYKYGSIVFLIIVAVGYILEYFILRKRFLMF